MEEENSSTTSVCSTSNTSIDYNVGLYAFDVGLRICYQYFQKLLMHSRKHRLCNAVLGVSNSRQVDESDYDKLQDVSSMPLDCHHFDASKAHL